MKRTTVTLGIGVLCFAALVANVVIIINSFPSWVNLVNLGAIGLLVWAMYTLPDLYEIGKWLDEYDEGIRKESHGSR